MKGKREDEQIAAVRVMRRAQWFLISFPIFSFLLLPDSSQRVRKGLTISNRSLQLKVIWNEYGSFEAGGLKLSEPADKKGRM
jgi:hypothetical protein